MKKSELRQIILEELNEADSREFAIRKSIIIKLEDAVTNLGYISRTENFEQFGTEMFKKENRMKKSELKEIIREEIQLLLEAHIEALFFDRKTHKVVGSRKYKNEFEFTEDLKDIEKVYPAKKFYYDAVLWKGKRGYPFMSNE